MTNPNPLIISNKFPSWIIVYKNIQWVHLHHLTTINLIYSFLIVPLVCPNPVSGTHPCLQKINHQPSKHNHIWTYQQIKTTKHCISNIKASSYQIIIIYVRKILDTCCYRLKKILFKLSVKEMSKEKLTTTSDLVTFEQQHLDS